MAKTHTTHYDLAEHLRTPEEMAAYLEACMEEAHGDAAFITKAIGDIARAKGMSQVARDAVAEKYEVVVLGPVIAAGPIGAYLYGTPMCPYCKKLNRPNLRECENCANALLPHFLQDKSNQLLVRRPGQRAMFPVASRAGAAQQHVVGGSWALIRSYRWRYHRPMTVAISLPDPVFRATETLAHKLKKSRSELYADAIAEYVSVRGAEAVTAKLDGVYAKESSELDLAL